MNRNKLIATVSLAVIVITMMTSNQLSIYASPTTEDDGYTYPDDASEEEKEEIDEQEQEAWEDAGRPGEQDNDKGDDGKPQQTFTCSDGSTVTGDEECPPTGPNPYCDQVPDNYQGTCHDRKDYYDGGPNNGLYPCNDGTDKADWRDCKDASTSGKKTESRNDDNSNTSIDEPSICWNEIVQKCDIPECSNSVVQRCVIKETGLICNPGDTSDTCQDVYSGTYKPLKTCEDGVVAVSCGVGRYWCSGGSGDSFHTNDWRDCEDASK